MTDYYRNPYSFHLNGHGSYVGKSDPIICGEVGSVVGDVELTFLTGINQRREASEQENKPESRGSSG